MGAAGMRGGGGGCEVGCCAQPRAREIGESLLLGSVGGRVFAVEERWAGPDVGSALFDE